PTAIPDLLSRVASGNDAALVTPELRSFTARERREQIGGWLKVIYSWTPLGCESVGTRGISRLRSRIEQICYAKGTAKEGRLLITVLYGSDWRAAGVDVYAF
ncbi:MAG: hypothetical protein ACJ8BF_09670, partial [Gemmatimonadales bacterium]